MPEHAQSRSHTVLKPDSTLIAVLEMSQSAWLVAGLVPGIERHPLKKIELDEAALLRLLRRWQEEATKAGHPIIRTLSGAGTPGPCEPAVGFEAERQA